LPNSRLPDKIAINAMAITISISVSPRWPTFDPSGRRLLGVHAKLGLIKAGT
jgi:hypothetical protein